MGRYDHADREFECDYGFMGEDSTDGSRVCVTWRAATSNSGRDDGTISTPLSLIHI